MLAGADVVTSQVSVGEYQEFWRPFLDAGKDVLHVTLSSGISGASRKAEEFLQAIIARRCPVRKEPGPTFLPERHKTALNLYFLPKRK